MPYFLLAAALVVLDQLVKLLVLRLIPLGGQVPFIPHLVELTYVQNTGAAFSLFSRRRPCGRAFSATRWESWL